MIRSARFWVSMAVLQILFGLGVFAATRAYYLQPVEKASAIRSPTGQAALVWPEDTSTNDLARLGSSLSSESLPQDPVEISRQADQYFASQQYDRAVGAYQRLLALSPTNVVILNNLGLTLHYLGRSEEALRKLNDGVALDPSNQRIWLTLGFVESQLGNVDPARRALTQATQIGSDESIRQSALQMLEELP